MTGLPDMTDVLRWKVEATKKKNNNKKSARGKKRKTLYQHEKKIH